MDKRHEDTPLIDENIKKSSRIEDPLSSSDANFMETHEQGKQNLRYTPSNGTLNIPFTGRHNSVPNGKLPLTNGLANGKVPLDRFSSVPSSSTRFENTNSVLELVIEKSPKKKKKTHCCGCKPKSAFWMLFVLSVIVIVTLSTLYIMELKKETILKQYIIKADKKRNAGCFIRASPIKLHNILNEPEIKSAIVNVSYELFKLFSKAKYHALSVNVLYMGDQIWSHHHGKLNFRDAESPLPESDTIYPIASVSKIFTVMMLEKLVDDGTIDSIDDEVIKYEPEFSVINPFNNNQITFRQLSCMLSGLQREAPCYPMVNMNLCPYNTTVVLKRVQNVTLINPPGTVPSYSNLGLGILGNILARLKNQTFEYWITENILKPLNMTNTGFNIVEKIDKIPVSTVPGGITADILEWGWLRPTGGMYSTLSDLGKLGSMFLQSSKTSLLSNIAINRMLKPEYIWSDKSSQGCPFEIFSIDPYNKGQIGYWSYMKDGSILGYAARFTVIPDIKLNINMLIAAETEGYINSPLGIVYKYFVPALDKLLKRKQLQYVLPENPQHFTGIYQMTTYWPYITKPCNISYSNGILNIELEWLNIPLTAYKGYTLKTFNNNRQCWMVALGLLKEEYVFTPPKKNEDKCPEFYINGITVYGYTHFKRIK